MTPSLDQVDFLRKAGRKLGLFHIKINYALKKFIAPYAHKEVDEKHAINDMDLSRHLYATATNEGNIQLRRLNDPDFAAFYLNAGSKTVKTYL